MDWRTMDSRLRSDKAAFYRIKVQGDLSPSWSDCLGGLDISIKNEQDNPYTILQGELLDQAALMGVLDSLYSMRFPILELVYQPSE